VVTVYTVAGRSGHCNVFRLPPATLLPDMLRAAGSLEIAMHKTVELDELDHFYRRLPNQVLGTSPRDFS
jgi:hypothetical protein